MEILLNILEERKFTYQAILVVECYVSGHKSSDPEISHAYLSSGIEGKKWVSLTGTDVPDRFLCLIRPRGPRGAYGK